MPLNLVMTDHYWGAGAGETGAGETGAGCFEGADAGRDTEAMTRSAALTRFSLNLPAKKCDQATRCQDYDADCEHCNFLPVLLLSMRESPHDDVVLRRAATAAGAEDAAGEVGRAGAASPAGVACACKSASKSARR